MTGTDPRPLGGWALATIGTVAALSIGALLGAAITLANNPAEAWDPLGEFPVQTVEAVTAEAVEVTGTKCYEEPVDVLGSFWWQSVDPPGTVAAIRTGTAARRTGCITNTFVNLVPGEVREADAALGGASWKLTGIETPIDELGGREGVPHTWASEPFRLVTGG